MIEFAVSYFPLYCEGTLIGLGLTALAMVGSVVIGLMVALARISNSRALRAVGATYVALFRGIPPLVLLYVIYFGLPTLAQEAGSPLLKAVFMPLDNRICAAAVAFAINSGAYSAEIIRAAITSVPVEQLEAARSIAMSYSLAMRRIILPQAIRIAFPPLGNEFITVLKGTSLASVIGVTELMRTAQMAASATFMNLTAYMFAAVFYIVLVIILQLTLGRLELWWTPGRRSAFRAEALSRAGPH
jgi:His/Glu/Gln/Arg/opine family amino acid ABC transporter permease subunit